MDLIVCECGRRIVGEDEQAVVAAMRLHLDAEHPLVAGAASAADLLALVETDVVEPMDAGPRPP